MTRRFRLPKNIEELAEWYMRYISPLSLVAGFILDTLFLAKRVDLFLTNALLFLYLFVSAAAICLINLIQSGRIRYWLAVKLFPLLPVVVQFAFGGLFSAYLSLYSRSASVAISWIFVVVLAALLLGNERFMRFYTRFSFQLSLYFAALFLFLIFFVPIVFHTIGPHMFVISGLTSVALIVLFLFLMQSIVPEIVQREKTTVARAIAIIFVTFHVLYFFNFIPPLPLSLKNAGVYHSVVREKSGIYVLTTEPVHWYESFFWYKPTFHEAPGDVAYVFTSVFAPTGLSTTIVHQWQYFDPTSREWVMRGSPRFSIIGGRDGGYRGYSFKSNLVEGKWRVDVLTQYGQLIGRVTFYVVRVVEPPITEQISQ